MTEKDPRVEELRRVTRPRYPASHGGGPYGSPSRSGAFTGPLLVMGSIVLLLIALWVLIEVLR